MFNSITKVHCFASKSINNSADFRIAMVTGKFSLHALPIWARSRVLTRLSLVAHPCFGRHALSGNMSIVNQHHSSCTRLYTYVSLISTHHVHHTIFHTMSLSSPNIHILSFYFTAEFLSDQTFLQPMLSILLPMSRAYYKQKMKSCN